MADESVEFTNLKVFVDNVEEDGDVAMEEELDLEDGEIADGPDDEDVEFKVSISETKHSSQFQQDVRKYENPAGDFITGLDLTSEELKKKREERAKRFGIQEVSVNEDLDLPSLYDSLGFTVESIRNSERGIRQDTLHIRGVSEMNTKEIFGYFKEYCPSSIEWIDDQSCNVLWLDTLSAARAMIGLSRRIAPATAKIASKSRDQDMDSEKHDPEKLGSKDEAMSEDDDELNLMSSDEDDDEKNTKRDGWSKDVKSAEEKKNNAKDASHSQSDQTVPQSAEDKAECDTETPPGKWRLGHPHPKAACVFLRYATKADRKQPGAEKRSRYYQKYGNPNYGGMKGLITTSRKRKIRSNQHRQETRATHDAMDSIPEGITTYDDLDMFGGTYVEPGDEPDLPVETKSRVKRSSDRYEDEDYEHLSGSDYEEDNPSQSDEHEEEHEEHEGEHEEEDNDGLHYEKELEILLQDQPKKRTMRMYADDLEDEVIAKKQRIESIKHEATKPLDARQKISAQQKGSIQDRLGSMRSKDNGAGDLRSRIGRKNQSRGRLKDLPNIKIEVDYEAEEEVEGDLELFGV